MTSRFVRTLTALVVVATSAITVTTPASAAVDLSVKQAIVSVVLENLGVQASDELIAEIAGEINPDDLSPDLCASVASLLDSGSDPRASIEGATDINGDGVPEAGAAKKSATAGSGSSQTDDDDSDESDQSTNTKGSSTKGNGGSGSSVGSPDDSDDDEDDEESDNDDDEDEDEDEDDD